MVRPVNDSGEEEPVDVIPPGLDVAVYERVPSPLPVKVGALKVTSAVAFPAVADPIIGASGLRPSWESVIPIFCIVRLYHNLNRFILFYGF